MPKPKTAKLTLEMTLDDGSKEIITTADLDASKLPQHHVRNPEEYADHAVIGMKDPYYDENDYFGNRRDRFINDFLAIPKDFNTHFFIDLQLAPVNPNAGVYTIQKIEAPDTNVVMIWNAGMPAVCSFNELRAQEKAEAFGTCPGAPIYFLLDIPA